MLISINTLTWDKLTKLKNEFGENNFADTIDELIREFRKQEKDLDLISKLGYV